MDKPGKHFLESERKFIHLLLTGKVDPSTIAAEFSLDYFDGHHQLLVKSIFSEYIENKTMLTRNRYRQKLIDGKAGGDLMENLTVYDRCFMQAFASPDEIGELKQMQREAFASRELFNATENIRKTAKNDGYVKALDNLTRHVNAISSLGNAITGGGLDIVNLANVPIEPVKWLWQDRIEIGAVNIFSGDPGSGKSFVTLHVAARISKGQPLPGADAQTVEGDTLMVAIEDSPSMIRQRYEAQGGDLSRAHIVRGKTDGQMFNLDTDMQLLEEAIKRHPETKLVVIDPINAYLGGSCDAHKTADVLRVLNPLHRFAQDNNLAVIAVRHMTKGGKNSPLHKGLGSISFSGTARTEWGFVRDREDEQLTNMVLLKMSHAAPTGNLTYKIQDDLSLEWGTTDISANEAFAECSTMPKGRAKEWLQAALADGPLSSETIQDRSHKDGISWRTLMTAKKELNVRSRKVGGHWEMELPAAEVLLDHINGGNETNP